MPKLEDFLAGKPLNEDMARLMRGEDEEDAGEAPAPHERFVDGTPITDHDREHLKKLMAMAGWQVLLKLLDRELQQQEDSARRVSLEDPRGAEMQAAWAELAADKKARVRVETLAEAEVGKMRAKKKSHGEKVQTS